MDFRRASGTLPAIPLPDAVPQPSMVFDTTVVMWEPNDEDVVVSVGVAVMIVSVAPRVVEPVPLGLVNVIVVLEMTIIE